MRGRCLGLTVEVTESTREVSAPAELHRTEEIGRVHLDTPEVNQSALFALRRSQARGQQTHYLVVTDATFDGADLVPVELTAITR